MVRAPTVGPADDRLRSIAFAVVGAGVLITDATRPDNPIVDANPAFERITGYRRDEILGRNCRFLQGPDTDPAVVARVRRAIRQCGDITETLLNYRKDGTPFWNEMCVTAVRDAAGTVTHFVGVQTDVTNLVRAEADARRNEARYRTLVERLPAVHFTSIGAELGAPSFIGPQLADLVGYAPAEWVADPGAWTRALHPDDHDRVLAEVAAANATGASLTSEYRLIARDGRVVWVRNEAVLIRDERGAPRAWHGFLLDVTERRRAEEDLRAETERLSAVVAMQAAIAAMTPVPEAVMRLAVARVMGLTGAGAAGIATLDGDAAVYRVVAGTASRVEGIPFPARQCVSGLSLLTGESYRVADSETDPLADRDLMRTAGVRSLLTAPLRYEGQVVASLSIGAPHPHAFGKQEEHLLALVAGIIGSALAHATALEAAQAAEARFRSLVENAPDVILVTDAAGAVTFASPAIERVLGYAPASIVGADPFDLVHPADSPPTREVFGAVAATPGGSGQRLNRMRRADGRWIWAEGIAQNRLDDPAVAGIVVNFRDVTEQVLAEQALRASEARLNEAQAIAHVGSWEWDIATGELRWSPEVYRIYHLDPDEPVTFERLVAIVHPDDRSRFLADAQRGLAQDDVFDLVHRIVLPSGETRHIHGRGTTERGPDGTPIRMLGTGQDITDRVRFENDLRAARDAAEEASRLKSAFLSTMSHELRTPLTAIMGYSNLLLEGIGGDLTPVQAADVTLIAAGAERLLALINDVLDLSRIGAGMLALDPVAVDLAHLVESVVAEIAPQAEAKSLAVAIDVPPALAIRADPLRLHQVLLNLVGNAVKFTDAGRVAISARPAGDRVEIAIADTGIGIEPAVLPLVFEEFRQADQRTTRRFGGSGLGLAIARRLVELHGGAIRAESAPGVGSTFTVDLPASGRDERTQEPGGADAARPGAAPSARPPDGAGCLVRRTTPRRNPPPRAAPARSRRRRRPPAPGRAAPAWPAGWRRGA